MQKDRKKQQYLQRLKNAENPHEQKKNPHFCGFFFGGDGGI
jgi:hypothetical protein